MAKEDITTNLNITGDELIQLLHEDLAGEYSVIINYTSYDLPETQTFEQESDRSV